MHGTYLDRNPEWNRRERRLALRNLRQGARQDRRSEARRIVRQERASEKRLIDFRIAMNYGLVPRGLRHVFQPAA